jgi:hypothetical protein
MKTALIVLFALAFVAASVQVVAQYTGSELEQKKPPELYPQPGPGELAIINKIEQTNQLLTEQNQLITEQNRFLKEFLSRAQTQPKVIR